jgi:hypothetical protein
MNDSLGRAREFLAELLEDLREAPAEFTALVEAYLPGLEAAINRFRVGEIGDRELDAGVLQIRLSYARDLQRQLGDERPTSRFVRSE